MMKIYVLKTIKNIFQFFFIYQNIKKVFISGIKKTIKIFINEEEMRSSIYNIYLLINSNLLIN